MKGNSNMNNSMKAKQKVLSMLEDMLMNNVSEKLRPKGEMSADISVKKVKAKPGESLEDVLDRAQEAEPIYEEHMDSDDLEEMEDELGVDLDNDEEEGEEGCHKGKPKKSLRDFFKD